MRDNLSVKQADHRRQIQLLARHGELCNVRHSLFVWPCGPEVPLQDIGVDFSLLTFPGTVFFHSDHGFQGLLVHQPLHLFVIHTFVLSGENRRYPSVSIASFMMLVYPADFSLYFCMPVRPVADRLLIIPGATGHPGGSQQVPQGMNIPQLTDYFCFFFY